MVWQKFIFSFAVIEQWRSNKKKKIIFFCILCIKKSQTLFSEIRRKIQIIFCDVNSLILHCSITAFSIIILQKVMQRIFYPINYIMHSMHSMHLNDETVIIYKYWWQNKNRNNHVLLMHVCLIVEISN